MTLVSTFFARVSQLLCLHLVCTHILKTTGPLDTVQGNPFMCEFIGFNVYTFKYLHFAHLVYFSCNWMVLYASFQ